MELTLGRNTELYHGLALSDSNGNTLLRIEGKKDDSVPTLLLTVDPHTVYGLSHPKVISKILATGPHMLITQKKLAHSLFEHGMKSSWGTIKVLNNKFQTSIETFYDLRFQHTLTNIGGFDLLLTSFLHEDSHYATLSYKSQVYVLSAMDVKPPTMRAGDKFINISSIKDYLTLVFDESEVSTIDSAGVGSTQL